MLGFSVTGEILVRHGSTVTTLPPLGTRLDLGGINDHGQFVLSFFDSLSGSFRIMSGDASGYSELPGILSGESAFPAYQAINNSRQVIFSISPPGGGSFQGASLWDPVSGRQDLSTLAGADIRFAMAINNLGQIIATRADGEVVLLDPVGVPEPGYLCAGGPWVGGARLPAPTAMMARSSRHYELR